MTSHVCSFCQKVLKYIYCFGSISPLFKNMLFMQKNEMEVKAAEGSLSLQNCFMFLVVSYPLLGRRHVWKCPKESGGGEWLSD